MTLYLLFEQLEAGKIKLSTRMEVSAEAASQAPTKLGVKPGQTLEVEDAIKALVTKSANDAATAIGEYLGGSEDRFAELMTQKARQLGMTGTTFRNASGLPDAGQQTTARDMALLGRALIRDFPQRYALFKQKEFTFNKIRQPNRNRLLWRDPSVDGIKTGHTEQAGYHLLASAVRDGRRLVTVVLGSAGEEERAQQTLALLNYGFRFFETATVAEARQPVVTVRAWKGESKELALGLAEPLVVSLPRGGRERLELRPLATAQVRAPVAAGQALGTLKVVLDGEVLREEPLVALSALPEGNLWRRITDGVQLWIQGF